MHEVFFWVGIFYIIPFLSLTRIFLLIRTREYLIGALIFLALTINGIGIYLFGLGSILEIITVYIAMYALIIVSERVLRKPDRWIYSMTLVAMTLLFILNIILINIENDFWMTFRIILFELNRLLVGLFLFVSYSRIDLFIVTKRTKLVKQTWKWSGVVLALISIIRIVDVQIYLLANNQYDPVDPQLGLTLNIIGVGMLMLSAVTSYLAIFYPEVFLLSKYQINAIEDLYEISVALESTSRTTMITQEYLMDYLTKLQEQNETESSTNRD